MMRAYAITNVGQQRKINQDYVFSSLEPVGNLSNLFIVADGMGGHQAGDFASHYAVEQVIELIRQSEETSPITILNHTITKANVMLIDESLNREDLYGMGTTFVAASIADDILYIANVGDSRLYIINEEIRQITKDHSLVEEMVARGELTRKSEGYQTKKNILTRAMGAALEIAVDCFDLELEENDYILMCSDGLTNMVSDSEIKEVICSEEGLQQKAEMLIAMANNNGGKDNIAVLLIESGLREVNIC